jgi:hypothetical protein
LKTGKVVLRQISALPLETQRTYLSRELLPISLNTDWLASIFQGKGKLSGAILRLNHLK